MSAAIELRKLTGGYGDTKVIFDVDARVEQGQMLGVLGRNGVGKTTLARLIQGGLLPTSGDIHLRGVPIGSLAPHERRRMGIGYMPQTAMVFDELTVRENLSMGTTRIAPDSYFERFPRLAERLDQPAGTMSGGERKMLAFVRTLVEDTDMLVLDEPSEGVQQENVERMASCLKERLRAGASIVLFEQNLGFLLSVSDRLLGLDGGRVVLDRAASETDRNGLVEILSI